MSARINGYGSERDLRPSSEQVIRYNNNKVIIVDSNNEYNRTEIREA